ncbi:MAG: ROK family protein [Fibrobacter sp.]|nr:ROK family protein [Fibrobacter sp.]
MEKAAIGIDLGGTNLKGIIMNDKGQGRHLTRVPTEAEKGGAHVLENILVLIEKLIAQEGSKDHISGVGIGTPGFVDDDGTVLGGAENLPGWKGTQIYKPILEKFGLKAIAANDVTVAALAEAKYGAGKGVRNSVCFALGTGIGGGIVIENHLYKGTHGMAGELGHIVVETNGIPCNCGQKGCVERYASATGIVNLAKKLSAEKKGKDETQFTKEVNGNPSAVTSKMVYDFVKKSDPVAMNVNEIACDMLARAVGITLNALSPDRVILGGGVMMAGQVIIDTVSKYTPRYCWPAIWERCEIVIAQLGEDAGVLGSGAMVFEELAIIC